MTLIPSLRPNKNRIYSPTSGHGFRRILTQSCRSSNTVLGTSLYPIVGISDRQLGWRAVKPQRFERRKIESGKIVEILRNLDLRIVGLGKSTVAIRCFDNTLSVTVSIQGSGLTAKSRIRHRLSADVVEKNKKKAFDLIRFCFESFNKALQLTDLPTFETDPHVFAPKNWDQHIKLEKSPGQSAEATFRILRFEFKGEGLVDEKLRFARAIIDFFNNTYPDGFKSELVT